MIINTDASSAQILVPILLHILWVCGLYILLVRRKTAAVKAGGVDLRRTAIDVSAWPDSVRLVSNNISNNFEAPVLFYAACIATYLLGAAGSLAVGLAYVFVISRAVHSWVHVNSNTVPVRMKAFAVGLLCILVLVVQTLIHLL